MTNATWQRWFTAYGLLIWVGLVVVTAAILASSSWGTATGFVMCETGMVGWVVLSGRRR